MKHECKFNWADRVLLYVMWLVVVLLGFQLSSLTAIVEALL